MVGNVEKDSPPRDVISSDKNYNKDEKKSNYYWNPIRSIILTFLTNEAF